VLLDYPARVRKIAGADFLVNECMGSIATACPLTGSQLSKMSGRFWPVVADYGPLMQIQKTTQVLRRPSNRYWTLYVRVALG
jgi:hypothetical protein